MTPWANLPPVAQSILRCLGVAHWYLDDDAPPRDPAEWRATLARLDDDPVSYLPAWTELDPSDAEPEDQPPIQGYRAAKSGHWHRVWYPEPSGPPLRWTLQALAGAIGVSCKTITRALDVLVERKLVVTHREAIPAKRGPGGLVVQPARMVDAQGAPSFSAVVASSSGERRAVEAHRLCSCGEPAVAGGRALRTEGRCAACRQRVPAEARRQDRAPSVRSARGADDTIPAEALAQRLGVSKPAARRILKRNRTD